MHGCLVIFFDFSATQNDEIIPETPDIPISRPTPALNAIPSSQTVEDDTPIAPLPFVSTPLYFFHSPTPAPNLTVSSSGTAEDDASVVPLPIGLPPSEFSSSPTLGFQIPTLQAHLVAVPTSAAEDASQSEGKPSSPVSSLMMASSASGEHRVSRMKPNPKVTRVTGK